MARREKPLEFHRYDILRNNHTRETNPGYHVIITGSNKDYVYGLSVKANSLHRVAYYKRDVMFDDAFEIVGHCDISVIIKRAIRDNIQ
jgi:hypothetical protein